MVIDQWKLPELEGLSPEADAAREKVLKHLDRVDKAATRLTARRERHAAEDERAAALASARTRSERPQIQPPRSEEHTSELQSLMRISYAVFCLTKKTQDYSQQIHTV